MAYPVDATHNTTQHNIPYSPTPHHNPHFYHFHIVPNLTTNLPPNLPPKQHPTRPDITSLPGSSGGGLVGGLSLVGASGLQGLGELVGVSTPANASSGGEEEEDDEEEQQFVLDPSVFTVKVPTYPHLTHYLSPPHTLSTPTSHTTYPQLIFIYPTSHTFSHTS